MRLGFHSTMCAIPWGGSEFLWSAAARTLQDRGHDIAVDFQWHERVPARLREIETHGGKIFWRYGLHPGLLGKIRNRLPHRIRYKRLDWWLDAFEPQFVLITAGYHTDDLSLAQACLRRGIPYALNVQCASTSHWITSYGLETFRTAYAHARRSFFLSRENVQLLETQLGMEIPRVEIVDNPLAFEVDAPLPWPNGDSVFTLACVGRVHFVSKGQDLVIEVLRQKKWRDRAIEVVFWGEDQGNRQQLESLIDRHGLAERARFGGFVSHPVEIWRNSHALLLPSRYEGLPIVTVEAMMCGRVPIVTRCGRNGELVDDDETGFVLPAATAELLDDALERAWARRHEWPTVGALAAERIRTRYSTDPVQRFVGQLEAVIHETE
jgi:glycosyltransferase involved in cell wall biosynthesis